MTGRRAALDAAATPAAVVPVTRAQAGSGSGGGAGNDPATNLAPSPNFLTSCAGSSYDNSVGCETATLAAINNARTQEGLAAMVLPTDWTQLSPQQQLFTATNLERTARGMAPLSALATALDQASAAAAAQNTDPSAPAGFPWSSWGGNWAGAMGSPLEAIYFWMYDDGLGSYNIDCTAQNTSGCWGHRNNILLSMRCQPCLIGTGFNATAYQGNPSWTEILVDSSGSPALDFTWSQVLADLPATPGRRRARRAGGRHRVDARRPGLLARRRRRGRLRLRRRRLLRVDGGQAPGRPSSASPRPPTGTATGWWRRTAGSSPSATPASTGPWAATSSARKVVGLAATSDGRGYWEVAADGGLFAFGDAGFFGSMGGHPLAKPVVGLAPTADGRGYWEVASDGGIFAFGDAPYLGSMGRYGAVPSRWWAWRRPPTATATG